MQILALAVSLALAVLSGACRQPGSLTTNPQSRAFEEFRRRVDAYMKIHEEVERSIDLERTASEPADLQGRRENLRATIQRHRADAKQGDIFTRDVAAAFRQTLNPEVRGKAAADTRAAIREGSPREFTLKPNAPYPEDAPYATIPPNVLAALPSLPDHVEYRIVANHLILRDVHANIIVDYMYDVMCAKC